MSLFRHKNFEVHIDNTISEELHEKELGPEYIQTIRSLGIGDQIQIIMAPKDYWQAMWRPYKGNIEEEIEEFIKKIGEHFDCAAGKIYVVHNTQNNMYDCVAFLTQGHFYHLGCAVLGCPTYKGREAIDFKEFQELKKQYRSGGSCEL